MSQAEKILHKAHRKGLFNETMSISQELKIEYPKMDQVDRYELAYKRAKKNKTTK